MPHHAVMGFHARSGVQMGRQQISAHQNRRRCRGVMPCRPGIFLCVDKHSRIGYETARRSPGTLLFRHSFHSGNLIVGDAIELVPVVGQHGLVTTSRAESLGSMHMKMPLSSKNKDSIQLVNREIAIIGVACRFPGQVNSLEDYWRVLVSGKDVITRIPESRWTRERYLHPLRSAAGKSCTLAAGVVESLDSFDHEFFGISRKEAEFMDPQQRLLLELAWEMLEHAKIPPTRLEGCNAAVYVGASALDASFAHSDDPWLMNPYSMTGNSLSIIANRLSFIYNFRGPSMTIDTACSSSLVAMHQACNYLRNDEGDYAIAGGVNALFSPFSFVGFSKANMLSQEGLCKVFDQNGDGYVRAEGGALVLLKRLDDAVRDGDCIFGVIPCTGVNTDGRSEALPFPSEEAQIELLRSIYESGSIDIDSMGYFEAHGTGTAAGDPVEARAIGKVLGALKKHGDPLMVGSAKSVIGHLEPASGMAGLLKALLVLRHKTVPPNLHLEQPHEDIDLKALHIDPITSIVPYPQVPGAALVGVNSFGFGGANAHVLVREHVRPVAAPRTPELRSGPAKAPKGLPPLFLSAKSRPALLGLAAAYGERIAPLNKADYVDLAASACFCRDHLRESLVVSGESPAAVATALRDFSEEREAPKGAAGPASLASGEASLAGGKTAFAFSGNGCQWPGMGKVLLGANKTFAATIKKVDASMKPLMGWSIAETLSGDIDPEKLRLTEVAQPLIFAIQVALVDALREKGVTPDVVFGHSVGEVSAAYACGALTLKQACLVMYHRSSMQARSFGMGRMAAVQLKRSQALELPEIASGELEIGAVNSPAYVTLTGDEEALKALRTRLKSQRVVFRMLDLDYPFHSKHMESFKDDLLQSLKGVKPSKGTAVFVSALAGEASDGGGLDAAYWWRNIRETVDFEAATNAALDLGVQHFMEIGPHNVLGHFISASIKERGAKAQYLASLKKEIAEDVSFEKAWQTASVSGWPLERTVFFPVTWNKVELPTYAWNRVDLTLKPSPKCLGLIKRPLSHSLLGFRKDGDLQIWENSLDTVTQEYLADHVIFGETICPAAAFLEIALAAARDVYDREMLELTQVAFVRPLLLQQSPAKDVRFVLSAEDGSFKFESRKLMSQDPWTIHMVGRIPAVTDISFSSPRINFRAPDSFGDPMDVEELYKDADNVGLNFRRSFRPMREAWAKGRQVLARLELHEVAEIEGMVLHPCLIDGSFHTMLAVLPHIFKSKVESAYLPTWVQRMRVIKPGRVAFALATVEKQTAKSIVASFDLFDESGALLARMEQCRFKQMDSQQGQLNKQRVFSVKVEPVNHPLHLSPVDFPSPRDIREVMEPALEELVEQLSRDTYYNELKPLCQAALLSHAHAMMRHFIKSDNAFTLEDLLKRGGIRDELAPYVSYILRFLVSRELAECKDGLYTLSKECSFPPAVELWRTIVSDYPAYLAEAVVLGRLGLHLLSILQGKSEVEDVLPISPGGIVDNFNSISPAARFQNAAILKLVRVLFKGLPPGRQMRIVEVGTGGGGLLKSLLPGLPKERFEYLATDSDPSIVEQLKASMDVGKSINFEQLDIEKIDVVESGKSGCFDLVLAGHALHEVPDVRQAVRNSLQLLSPGGVLVLLERRPDPLIDFFLGLRPWWWNLSPSPDQPVSRLMAPDMWQKPLAEAGFESIEVLTEPCGDLPESFIIVARRPVTDTVELPTGEQDADESVWVLLEDGAPGQTACVLGDELASRLSAGGATVRRVRSMLHGEPVSAAEGTESILVVDPEDVDSWDDLLTSLTDAYKAPLKFVHLMGFDTEQVPEPQRLDTLQNQSCVSAAMLGKAWDRKRPAAELWLLRGGALEHCGKGSRTTPSQGALWGLGRVMMNELPGLTPRLVDLHCETPDGVLLEALVRELNCPTQEREVLLSNGQRFCPRFYPTDKIQIEEEVSTDHVSRIALTFDTPGKLERLYWMQLPDRLPGPGEVEIRTRATGLNFRDVMYTLGMLPEEALEDGHSGPTIGLECSGEVVAVGDGVADVQVGDEVICMAGGCFDSHVIVKADSLLQKPKNLGFEEAATIPTTFFTAYYALKQLADLQPGERVLIHGAAGGVGLAAIQVAWHLGAEIYATAGSEEKRDFLMLLGLKNVLNSRSVTFVDDVKRLTNGEGVDVVLNSLSGEMLFKSFSLLKPMGRFLELGKRDFFGNTPLRMRPFRKNITFFGIDVDQLMVFRPQLAHRLLREIMDLFEAGVFKPLVHSVYPRPAAVEAFRAMQHSTHIGKLVISFDNSRFGVLKLPQFTLQRKLDPTGSYLVTGGLGGFGLATARRLCANGARNLMLLSRSGAAKPEQQKAVASLEEQGVRVKVLKADVSDPKALNAALKTALAELPPLRGIVHSATVIDDGILVNMTPERIIRVLRAKALGAWNLHLATLDQPLEFFILYSSATTVLGNPGQANYVAANTMLESLANYRRSLGLPVLAVGWGPIVDTGMLVSNAKVLDSLKKMLGVAELTSKQALDFLDKVPEVHGSNLFLFNLSWHKVRQLPFASSPMFNLIDELSKERSGGETTGDPMKLVRDLPREEAIEALAASVTEQISNMLRIPSSKLDPNMAVVELGMDSLMAVELGLMLEENYGIKITAFSLGEGATIRSLAERIYNSLVSGGDEEAGDVSSEEIYESVKGKHGIKITKEQAEEIARSVGNPSKDSLIQ